MIKSIIELLLKLFKAAAGPKLKIPQVPQQCIDLIKKYEGLRLKPYLDAVNIPTIGYGTTYYPGGTLVTMQDPEITEAQAESYLAEHAYSYYKQVEQLVLPHKLNNNQMSALTSFAYNLGVGALAKSTLLKKLKVNPNDPSIRLEFQKWTKAGGVSLKGLERRRNEEALLYFET